MGQTSRRCENRSTPSSTTEVSRRTFCNELMLVSTGLLLTGTTLAAPASKQQTEFAYPPLKIDGAAQLMPGAYLHFNYPGPNEPAILYRSQQGEYFAYSRRCAHRACTVEFDGAQKCLRCPCHLGAYDLRTGFVLYGPPPRPLDQVVLQIRAGGEVWATGKNVVSTDHDAQGSTTKKERPSSAGR
jgi:Rieske Fe-S protein